MARWWGRAKPPTDPITAPVPLARPLRRVWRLRTTRGRLAVQVCALCAALVAVDGAGQHDAWHWHASTSTRAGDAR